MKTYEVWVEKNYCIGFRIKAKNRKEAINKAFNLDEDDEECIGISDYTTELGDCEEVNNG